MHAELLLTTLGIASYSAASVLAVLTLLQPERRREAWVVAVAGVGAALLAAVLLLRGLHVGDLPFFSRFETLTSCVLISSVAWIILYVRGRARGLAGLLVPLMTAVLLVGAPSMSPIQPMERELRTFWLRIHAGCALGALSIFALAAVLALAYLIQDRKLKHKNLSGPFPALEALERLISGQIGLAFLLLTGAIGIGVFLVRLTGGGREWVTDPKIVATMITWGIYASLVHLRAGSGRHGRSLALISLAGFACICFAIVGVHILVGSVHSSFYLNPPPEPLP